MDLNYLLIFKKVVETGGFSAAAAQLGLPKSSVSQKITQLEQELGVRLLHRTTRRIGLTEIGERIFDAASRVSAEAEDIKALVNNLYEEPSGLLRVTAPLDFGTYVISRVLHRFLERYPKITVEMDLSNRYVDLASEGIDVALRAASGPLKESSLVARPLFTVHMKLFASPSLVRRMPSLRAIQDLQAAPALWFAPAARRQPTTWRLEAGDQRVDIPVQASLRANDFLALKKAAVAGLGVGLLPEIVCIEELERGDLVVLFPEWSSVQGSFYAAYPSRKYLPAKTRAFVDFLRQRVGEECGARFLQSTAEESPHDV